MVTRPTALAQTTGQTTDAPPGVAFHPASGLDDAAQGPQVQADARKRILRAFVRRGLIEADDAKEMAGYQHGGGFSVDAGVCIDATDRAGRGHTRHTRAHPAEDWNEWDD